MEHKGEAQIPFLKKEEAMEVLSELGINPYDFNYEDLEPSEISEGEALAGTIKISDIVLEVGEQTQIYISLSEKKDGSRSLYITNNDKDINTTKAMVDRYSEVFGPDINKKTSFTDKDLAVIDENLTCELREWKLPGFLVVIGYHNKEVTFNYLLVEEN